MSRMPVKAAGMRREHHECHATLEFPGYIVIMDGAARIQDDINPILLQKVWRISEGEEAVAVGGEPGLGSNETSSEQIDCQLTCSNPALLSAGIHHEHTVPHERNTIAV